MVCLGHCQGEDSQDITHLGLLSALLHIATLHNTIKVEAAIVVYGGEGSFNIGMATRSRREIELGVE